MLFRLVDMLPQDRNGILGCCNPVPILVRKNIDRIFDIISEARRQPVQMVNKVSDLIASYLDRDPRILLKAG